jgi:hypothetical protein
LGSLYDRMNVAGPLWKAMRDTFQSMVTMCNSMRGMLVGMNPHLTDDVTNVAASADAAAVLGVESMQNAHQALYVAYEAHRASATHHAAADATNTLSAEPTPKAVMDLLNAVKTKYELHRVGVAAHGAADAVNTIAAANATTKATAIALANQLKAQMNAHMILTDGGVHGASGAVNEITYSDAPADASWAHLAAMTDQIKAKYEAHRVNVDGGIHTLADAANAVTQEDVGVIATRDIKAKFNLHLLLATAHKVIDQSMKVAGADAVTSDDAVVLTREIIGRYKTHISRATQMADFPEIAAL